MFSVRFSLLLSCGLRKVGSSIWIVFHFLCIFCFCHKAKPLCATTWANSFYLCVLIDKTASSIWGLQSTEKRKKFAVPFVERISFSNSRDEVEHYNLRFGNVQPAHSLYTCTGDKKHEFPSKDSVAMYLFTTQ